MSQPIWSTPNTDRAWLMTPFWGFMSTWKVMPTPTVETRTGKKTTERRYPRPTIWEVSRMPSAIPSTTLAPEVTTA